MAADGPVGADGSEGEVVDGRRARRERNREKVVEALLSLYREGELQPSTDQIAERAGLSPRSLFRYFDDVEGLARVAVRQQLTRIGDLFFVDVDPDLPLADRVASFVEQRLRLYEAMGTVGVVARAREPFQPLIAAELRNVRELLRLQLGRIFAAELDALDADERTARLAAADALVSFESYRLLSDDQGLARSAIAAALATGLTRLLT